MKPGIQIYPVTIMEDRWCWSHFQMEKILSDGTTDTKDRMWVGASFPYKRLRLWYQGPGVYPLKEPARSLALSCSHCEILLKPQVNEEWIQNPFFLPLVLGGAVESG